MAMSYWRETKARNRTCLWGSNPAGSAALAITLIHGCALAMVLWRADALATIPHPERI